MQELTAPINNFFDNVMVMDKDEQIKKIIVLHFLKILIHLLNLLQISVKSYYKND